MNQNSISILVFFKNRILFLKLILLPRLYSKRTLSPISIFFSAILCGTRTSSFFPKIEFDFRKAAYVFILKVSPVLLRQKNKCNFFKSV
ncbi:hypothetical protein A0128_00690 [Leptospira tipperaryensis]|uniref:Uncharacterized protein n=1 Tax=Leptospira tipperaryensis TaxID=2564040 RepID=A0A1D7USC6_9LEPT|nr:hypothetical protein A0128_00690 [Leptospira tipperaryensis]